MKRIIKYAVIGFAGGSVVAAMRIALLPLSLLEAPLLPLLGAGGGVYLATKGKKGE